VGAVRILVASFISLLLHVPIVCSHISTPLQLQAAIIGDTSRTSPPITALPAFLLAFLDILGVKVASL
jgi:hypothetical protein